MTYAFRCRNCLRLVEAEAAGENAAPHSCPSCGKGVHFEVDTGGNPVKILEPDNWVVLGDLSDKDLTEVLEYHSLSAKDITKHTAKSGLVADGAVAATEPLFLAVSAVDAVGSEDAAS